MKILFVSSYYLPYVSGLTIHAQRLAEGLVKRKHYCTIITNNHTGKLKSEETVNGVKILRSNPLFRLSRGFISYAIIRLFINHCRLHNRIVLHLPMPEAFLFAFIAGIFRKPVYLIYHANLNLPSWSIFGRVVEVGVFINHMMAGLLASKIIAYSQDYADYANFLKLFRAKVKVITPPVTISQPDLKATNNWKKELGLEGSTIVGFAGRFAEEKGGDILIECLPFLKKNINNVKLVFAGEANLTYEDFYRRKKTLIDSYRNDIVFIGLVPPMKMNNFYAMCDVLALPSRAECFGLVQAEAMLCGTPVVAFDIPGGRVPITLTGMGLLAEPYRAVNFAEKLSEVIQNRNKYHVELAQIRKIFNIEKTLDEYEKTIMGASNKN